MAELKGSLNGIGLPAMVQLIAELHHSGRLELSKGAAQGVLDFDDGRLVAAAFADECGLEALATLSSELGDADFSLVAGPPVREHTLDLGPTELQAYLGDVANGMPVEPEHTMSVAPIEREETLTTAPPVPQPAAPAAPPQPQPAVPPDPQPAAPPEPQPAASAAPPEPQPAVPPEPQPAASAAPPAPQPAVPAAPPPRVAPLPTLRPPPIAPPTVPAPATISPPADVPTAVPAGVAARPDAAGQMRAAEGSPAAPPTLTTPRRPQTRPPAPPQPRPPLRPGLRRPLRIGIGVVTVLVLAAVAFIGFFARGRPTAPEPPVAADQAVEPVAAGTGAPALAVTPAPPRTDATLTAAVATTAPTPVPEPATAFAATQPTTTSGDGPLIDVRFAAGEAGWLNKPPFAAWADGAYRLQARQAGSFVAVGAPINELLRDVVVSATFRKTGGGPGGGYGLIVRDQGPEPRDGANQNMSAYVLEAGDRGEFGIWRRDGDHWVDLVPWTPSTSVRSGGSPNDLMARAAGSRLTFTINGTEVATVEDRVLAAGKVGAFVGGDTNEVALDHFTVDVPN